jgi:hypothetical protein
VYWRETCADNAISKAISDRDTGIPVMPMRYALPRDWCSCERKRHRRIRTADSMGWILEPRIATFQRRELVFQPKAHFACWSHARPDSFKDSLLFLQLVHAKESLIGLRKA